MDYGFMQLIKYRGSFAARLSRLKAVIGMMKTFHNATLLAVVLGLGPASVSIASPQAALAGQMPDANPVGMQSYAKHCAICHGEQREGNPPGFPLC
jgi:mono/diheme cytochrome c family protein